MIKSKRLTSPNEVRIFSNPFRMKILSLFQFDIIPLTVKQMADKLGEVPSKVHYHVKELEKISVLEIVETREKSGIVEKYYFPTAENFLVDNIIKTSKTNVYEDGQDDFIGLALKEVNKNLDSFREHVNENEDSGRLISQLDGYLTPAETRELHDIIVNYIKSKQKKEEANHYSCSFLTIKKFE